MHHSISQMKHQLDATLQLLFLQSHSTCFGRLRLKHVEWPCRNKTCTVLHQVGVSFDLSVYLFKRNIYNSSSETQFWRDLQAGAKFWDAVVYFLLFVNLTIRKRKALNTIKLFSMWQKICDVGLQYGCVCLWFGVQTVTSKYCFDSFT